MTISIRALLAVLVAATAYEVALALRLFDSGADWAFTIGLLALLAAAVTAFVGGGRGVVPREAALLAPAGAAFMLAHLYTYDPYYGPEERTYLEHGMVSPVWAYLVFVAGLAAGALTATRPRAGAAVTGAVLVLTAGTAFVAGIGH